MTGSKHDCRTLEDHFWYSSAEGGKFQCAHFKSDFNRRLYQDENLQRTDIKNVLFIEVNRHLVFSSQTFEMSNICIFIDLGFFKEREGVCRE